MTLAHIALLVVVVGVCALALGVDFAAVVGWLKRRWQ